MQADIAAFFDEDTNTVTYLVSDPSTRSAAVIDSVLDFDPKSGRTSTRSADSLIKAIRDRDLNLQWILETHVHADHLTAAPYIKEHLGGRIAIGEHVRSVQKVFKGIFNLEPGFTCEGREFDLLLHDGQRIAIGALEATIIHTPGHTPADLTYLIGNAAFVGDTLFQPDYGTARADFPGGDARLLYRSIRKILALPLETRIFTCHDYKAKGRDAYVWESTVAQQREGNVHVHDGVEEDDFVAMRTARDAQLDMPRLILPSVQINARAGHFPPPEANGTSYLKLPLNRF
jgi:glyoxylase-like metal-dependent hydrolase (beta-lactamase superfamily II)